jgi:hypothetical protein
MSLEKYCCPSLGTKGTICASDKRKGGISALGILKIGQVSITDYTDETEWATAIANGDAVLISDIRGELTEASEIESDRLIGCGNETELDGFNQLLTWQDRAVNQANNQFYQQLNGCTYHLVIFDCQKNGTDIIHVVDDNEVSFVCKPVMIEAGTTTTQKYMCSAKWTSNFDEFPTQYSAPTGIFS